MLHAKGSRLIHVRRIYNLLKQIKTHAVIPDVIDCPPHKVLKVLYADGVQVRPGATLKPAQTQNEPLVSWECDANSYHVICMTDPDAPSRSKPELREFQHWLVGNVLGCKQHTGKTLTDYMPCGPPEGSGLHRYVYLVFRQNDEIKFDVERIPGNRMKNRGRFSIRKFAEKYNLGNPIACNFFLAAYDDSVPALYAKCKD